MKKAIRETQSIALPSSPQIINGVLENVKILGLESKNGRRYLAEAVEKALAKYENRPVYLNHSLSQDPRKIEDKFAKVVSPRRDVDGGIRANLRVNWKHPFAEVFKGWLETDPSAIGLSHVVSAEVSRDKDGNELVTEIYEVDSVDLVGDPATTKGLFESMNPDAFDMAPSDDGYVAAIGELVQKIMMDATLDVAAKKKKILGALKLMDDAEAGDKPAEIEEETPEEEEKEVEESDKPDEEMDSDDGEEKEEQRKKEIKDLITETIRVEIRKALKLAEDKAPKSLPPAGNPVVTFDTFLKTLSECK